MLLEKHPINIHDSCSSKDGTTFTRKINLTNYLSPIRIKCVAVSNQDNAGIRVNVGYMHGNTAYYFDTIVLTNDLYFYNTLPDILLYPDNHLILKFVSPNTGDKFLINIIGEEEVYSDTHND